MAPNIDKLKTKVYCGPILWTLQPPLQNTYPTFRNTLRGMVRHQNVLFLFPELAPSAGE